MDNTPIRNLQQYNDRMHQSVIDKIFFFDKVEARLFVDVGCADGALLKLCSQIFPNHEYLGFDIKQEMIDLANADISDMPNNLSFTACSSQVREAINNCPGKTCIILSSMIHEVYAYKREVQAFWESIWGFNADFVVIRDMCYSQTCCRPADPITVTRIRQVFDPNKIREWESQWGSLEENWSLVHFLLTYHYEENWQRELRENYWPISKEDLLSIVPNEYMPIFVEHYTLPYLRRKVKSDFGIELQERTHLKLIVEKLT
jgi:SAM-dependent methyltransferase